MLAQLVPSITKSAEMVKEVAASSQEQSAGVAQMTRAMSQVDDLTQRNASAAEELSSTAEELAAQAETLQQLISFFHIEGDSGRAERPSTAAVDARTWRAPAHANSPRKPATSVPAHIAAAKPKARGASAGA
jgi:methyl-accepting chemotaxis protein